MSQSAPQDSQKPDDDQSGQSEIEQMLRDSVAGFLEKSSGLDRARSLRGSHPGLDRKIWSEMAEAGWLGLMFDESHGGLGLGLTEMAVVAEELARGLVPEPVVGAIVLAAGMLRRSDNKALQDEFLPKIAAGEIIPALAWQEKAGDLDPDTCSTTAEKADGSFVLNGVKRFVPMAEGADILLVTAQISSGTAPDGLAAFLVWPDSRGVSISQDELVDGTFSTTVTLKDVAAGSADVIAYSDIAGAVIADSISDAVVMVSAELLGMMEEMHAATLQFLRDRVQFDVPVGSFQSLQHRAVDLYLHKELTRDRLNATLVGFGQSEDDAAGVIARKISASQAKARAADAGQMMARQTVQLHGAIGYTDELDVTMFVRRTIVRSAWLGNAALHRRRFAELSPIEEGNE